MNVMMLMSVSENQFSRDQVMGPVEWALMTVLSAVALMTTEGLVALRKTVELEGAWMMSVDQGGAMMMIVVIGGEMMIVVLDAAKTKAIAGEWRMSECHVGALTTIEDLVELLMSPGALDVGLMMTGVQEGVQMMKGEGAEAWMTWGHVVEMMPSHGNL